MTTILFLSTWLLLCAVIVLFFQGCSERNQPMNTKPLLPGACPGCGNRTLAMHTELAIVCECGYRCNHNPVKNFYFYGDPTPEEIAERAAEIRASWPDGVQPGHSRMWSARRREARMKC